MSEQLKDDAGAWQKLPDMPVGKWEAATVVIDDTFYLFGGYAKGVKSSKRVHIFDPKDGRWTQIQDLPSANSHANAVLDGRKVWFAGGSRDGGSVQADMWVTDAP
ncbi:MAG: kelch repeat-containing protein [Desulfobacterales bacterium]